MMRNSFYLKLAWDNIRKNSQTYIPYLLTCIGSVMMFYMMSYLALEPSLDITHPDLGTIMTIGVWVIAIFSVIFLFYTHSFLIKRRKREFGVFNILGMEKRHISRVLFLETVYVAGISLAAGISGGILFSKLMHLIVMKMLRAEVPFGFSVTVRGLIWTLLLFSAIFLLTFLNTFRQIQLSDPIQLLSGSQVGEREPQTKWLMTLIGVAALGGGYYIALTTKQPLQALMMFFVAVILVMIGTYCLFTAGSIAILKQVKKNKKLYYRPRNFTAISGMVYRMKQNAAGLANICILSTAVLIVVSTTTTLYVGLENTLRTRYPSQIGMSGYYLDDEETDQMRTIIGEVLQDYEVADVYEERYAFGFGIQEEDQILAGGTDSMYSSSVAYLSLLTPEIYEVMSGETVTLAADEVLLFEESGVYEYETIQIGGNSYKVKEKLDDLRVSGDSSVYLGMSLFLILPQEEDVWEIADYLYDGDGDGVIRAFNFYYGIDLDAAPEVQIAALNEIGTALDEAGLHYWGESREANRQTFYDLYGGLFFLGIFLGILFLMATVLIIYYKQISEGQEDKQRFEIMQKVGMDEREVKASIRSQVLTVFYLPLVMACVHTVVAYPVLTQLLALMNLSDAGLFRICMAVTMLIFALIYAGIYALTARTYYRIVRR